MTAYKWLAPGRRSPSGSGVWTPGRARGVRGEIVPCKRGIHYCRLEHLAHWIAAELWTFEDLTPGEAVECEAKMVTRRGKIIDRVEAWTPQLAADFAGECAARAQESAVGALAARFAAEAARTAAEAAGEPMWPAVAVAAREAREAEASEASQAAWVTWAAATSVMSIRFEPRAPASEAAAAAKSARAAAHSWQSQRLAEMLGLPDAVVPA